MIATVVRVEAGCDAKLAGGVRVGVQRERARAALDLAWSLAGAPDVVRIVDGEGAPLPTGGWHWSQSHTRDCAAAVVATEPIGIDVEPIALRKAVSYANVVSDTERALLGKIDELLFTRLWTAKECVLKRARVGLAELSDCRVVEVTSPSTMRVAHRGAEHLVQQSIAHGFVVSLATTEPVAWTWSA